MQAFSNENIKDYLCGGCDCTGFVPSVTYAYDAEAQEIVVTDATTFPAGTDLRALHIQVYDRKGHKAFGTITTGGGNDTIDLSGLDPSEGIDVLATVVTDAGCISDGHASNIQAEGSLGSWDKDNDAITVGSAAASS